MAAFFRFQRVRIVRAAQPGMVGRECVLVASSGPMFDGWKHVPHSWETDLPHPNSAWLSYHYYVSEDQIEPLRYEPDAEDLATLERPPDFRLKSPAPALVEKWP